MRGRIALLHSAVVAASAQFPIAFEQRRTDGDSAFPEPNARLLHGGLQHGEIHFSILFCARAHFPVLHGLESRKSLANVALPRAGQAPPLQCEASQASRGFLGIFPRRSTKS